MVVGGGQAREGGRGPPGLDSPGLQVPAAPIPVLAVMFAR